MVRHTPSGSAAPSASSAVMKESVRNALVMLIASCNVGAFITSTLPKVLSTKTCPTTDGSVACVGSPAYWASRDRPSTSVAASASGAADALDADEDAVASVSFSLPPQAATPKTAAPISAAESRRVVEVMQDP